MTSSIGRRQRKLAAAGKDPNLMRTPSFGKRSRRLIAVLAPEFGGELVSGLLLGLCAESGKERQPKP